jgi:hypothetical protein
MPPKTVRHTPIQAIRTESYLDHLATSLHRVDELLYCFIECSSSVPAQFAIVAPHSADSSFDVNIVGILPLYSDRQRPKAESTAQPHCCADIEKHWRKYHSSLQIELGSLARSRSAHSD